MFTLNNGLEIECTELAPNLTGRLIWRLSEIGDEFWEHPEQPQLLFEIGAETNEGLISAEYKIDTWLGSELPEYCSCVENDTWVLYRRGLENEGKELTFENGVDRLRSILAELEIEQVYEE